jgi:GAF domain-containing protein
MIVALGVELRGHLPQFVCQGVPGQPPIATLTIDSVHEGLEAERRSSRHIQQGNRSRLGAHRQAVGVCWPWWPPVRSVTTMTSDSVGRDHTHREWAADKREFVLNERERVLDERERMGNVRDGIADERERLADQREALLGVLTNSSAADARLVARDRRVTAELSRGEARRIALAAIEVARSALEHAEYVPPLVAEFAVVAKHLYGSADIEECLTDIVEFTQRLIRASDVVTLTTVNGSEMHTAAATSDLGRAVDDLQYTTGQGPIATALQSSGSVATGDLHNDDRWPELAPLTQAISLPSALSACIALERAPAQLIGVLNQYSSTPDAYTKVDHEVAVVLAAHAAVAIAANRDRDQPPRRTVHDNAADVIARATRELMEHANLTADEAFDVLRAASHLVNSRITDIAASVAAARDPNVDN